MLTLKTKDIPTLEIELMTGEQIHVLPATKRIIDKMSGFDPKTRNTSEMYKLLAAILSYNRENIQVSEEDLADVPVSVIADIMREYTAFINGKINSAKN